MVTILVRLKLTLLVNSLRRSVWRTVGLVVGLVYGLGAVVAVLVGLVALRFTSTGSDRRRHGGRLLVADPGLVADVAAGLRGGRDGRPGPVRPASGPGRRAAAGPAGRARCSAYPGWPRSWSPPGWCSPGRVRGPLTVGRTRRLPARRGHLCAAGPGGDRGARRGARLPAVPRPGSSSGFALFGVVVGLAATCSAPSVPPIRAGCGSRWPLFAQVARLVAVRLGLGGARRRGPRPAGWPPGCTCCWPPSWSPCSGGPGATSSTSG